MEKQQKHFNMFQTKQKQRNGPEEQPSKSYNLNLKVEYKTEFG